MSQQTVVLSLIDTIAGNDKAESVDLDSGVTTVTGFEVSEVSFYALDFTPGQVITKEKSLIKI